MTRHFLHLLILIAILIITVFGIYFLKFFIGSMNDVCTSYTRKKLNDHILYKIIYLQENKQLLAS